MSQEEITQSFISSPLAEQNVGDDTRISRRMSNPKDCISI